jgi:hypothetical protein
MLKYLLLIKPLTLNLSFIPPEKRIFNKKSDFFNKVSQNLIPLNISRLNSISLP